MCVTNKQYVVVIRNTYQQFVLKIEWYKCSNQYHISLKIVTQLKQQIQFHTVYRYLSGIFCF